MAQVRETPQDLDAIIERVKARWEVVASLGAPDVLVEVRDLEALISAAEAHRRTLG